MVKVVITDYEAFEDISVEREILEPLGCEVASQREYTNEKDLIALVSDADYVVTLYAPITEKVINSMTKCKAICRYGIGVDNIDIEAAAKRNIPACNNPDYCIDEVADHNLALILNMARDVQRAALETKKGAAPSDAEKYQIKVMKELVIGLIGFGKRGAVGGQEDWIYDVAAEMAG